MSKKKLLITGASGFIGSHLAELCVELGFNVVAFDRYNSNSHSGWLEDSKYRNHMDIILGDVRDYDSVYKVMKGCGSVFHLAALIGIPYSYTSPLAYIRTNVEGTYNVLESAKNLKLEQILITSTSETYGTAQYVPIDEKHPMVGQSPYSASKIAADQLAISYFRSFDMPVKIVRPFNTYGPRQSARAVIPTIISQCYSDNRELRLGNVDPTRDLTFVKDICTAFLEIFKSDEFFGKATNIGMNTEISVEDLAHEIMNILKVDLSIINDNKRVRPENSEVERLVCDNQKLLKCSSWKPKYDLKQGLIETIHWFQKNRHLYKAGLYHI